jgi:hypothetical protein
MTTTTETAPREAQSGPPLGPLAIVFTALFVASLVVSTVLAGGDVFPSPFDGGDEATAYFTGNPDALKFSAVLQFGSSIPLAIFAASVTARLNRLGIRAPGATIAHTGGVLAAAFLILSALTTWLLSRPGIVADTALTEALRTFAFLTGGTAHVVALGLLLAGIAVPALLARLFSPALAWIGLVLAAIAELSTITLVSTDLAFLLPIARFGGLIWLIAAAFNLPRRRLPRNAASA